MTDTDVQALCRIEGLTDHQLAGINALGQMTDAQVAAFAPAFDAAWDANRQAVTDAKAAIPASIANIREVEGSVAAAARERNPLRPAYTQDELDAVNDAIAAYQTAKETHEAAKATFKAGVTQAQLEERL